MVACIEVREWTYRGKGDQAGSRSQDGSPGLDELVYGEHLRAADIRRTTCGT